MKKNMKDFVFQNYPQKAKRIIEKSLTDKQLQEAGIVPLENEIFVQIPFYPDYFGSNHGRLLSKKRGVLKLRKQNLDRSGHINYVLTQRCRIRDGQIIGSPKRWVLGAQQMVGLLFLPNYWEKCTSRQLDVHHLDRDPSNNRWDNLLLCPKWVHRYAEYVDSYWVSINGKLIKKTPYEIMNITGMTLEEVVYPVRREPDVCSKQDGHDLEIYSISDWYLGYELADPNFRQMLLERGRHMGKSPRKKKTGAGMIPLPIYI